MLKVSDLATKIQNDLNTSSSFEYIINSEVSSVNTLPKQNKGYAIQDNRVLGLLRTVGGSYVNIPNQSVYDMSLTLNLFILKDQYNDVYTELMSYIQTTNGVPFVSSTEAYIPNMEVIEIGVEQPLQGALRIPVTLAINYTIVQNAKLLNSVSISIDGTRVYPLSWNIIKVKATSEKQLSNTIINTSKLLTQSINFAMSILETPSINFIQDEIFETDTLIKIHSLAYKDDNIDKTYNVVFSSITEIGEAGGVKTLNISGTLSRDEIPSV